MVLLTTLVLSFVASSFATPLAIQLDHTELSQNATFVECVEGTKDPICLGLKRPSFDVITEILHPDGTTEVVRNKYTREQLKQVRLENKVKSVESKPGDVLDDKAAEFVGNVTKRDNIRICRTETQKWYDTQKWGYWYPDWRQVGNCFYCDQCTEAIAVGFSVTQTWTVGLSAKFNEVLTGTFGFSWGNMYSLTDTRTCQWNFVESGCHSIWYQPLMSYHDGWANYQTHTVCQAGQGLPGSDVYLDHNYAWANVNAKASDGNGPNQGNLGCNSGCGGNDHRQCVNANSGGLLWPRAN